MKNRANHEVERDALGSDAKRVGSSIVLVKERCEKPDLDIIIFNDCRSILYQQEEKPDSQILGISFHGKPHLYLGRGDWNSKGLKKLMTEAGVSVKLSRNRSQKDALEKALTRLIQEAQQQGPVVVPSTYGWHGSGDQFRRIRKSHKDLIWKELEEQCVR